jgi:hypothetical protein
MNTSIAPIPATLSKWKSSLPLYCCVLLLVIYFANCFTPLRLTHDTIHYLNLKDWIENGFPPNSPEARDFLPYGYVTFLLVLSKLHLANSFFICFVQCIYFLSSLWFLKKIFQDRFFFWQLVVMAMLNWSLLKFVITPLSEMQFLFFSTGAIYFFSSYGQKNRIVLLIVAFLFAIAAALTRIIGITLILALLLTLVVNRNKTSNSPIFKKWMLAGIIVFILLFLFLAPLFRIEAYIQHHAQFFRALNNHPIRFIATNVKNHLIDWSSVFLNFPFSKLPVLPYDFWSILYLLFGVASFGWIAYILINPRFPCPLVLRLYLAFYFLVILTWPLFEPRLWTPVAPFCLSLLLLDFTKRRGMIKSLISIFKFEYIFLGLISVAYYTYTSFDKKELAKKQDAGIWRNEYETYFFGKSAQDSIPINDAVVDILKKYK